MKQRAQNKFMAGVNRRGSREEPVKDGFWTLQNARLFERGNTGVVSRISGYSQFNAVATNYSNILDLINFKDKFIALYEDAVTSGTFHIDVYSSGGTREFTDSYTAFATSEGSLVITDDTIFVSPHNKVLYDDDGGWVLADFISDIPTLTGITTIDNSVQASGSIVVTGGASPYAGKKARGRIRVKANNTREGDPDTFKIKVGSVETAEITVNYQDSIPDVRDKMYDALQDGANHTGGDITTDWEILKGLEDETDNLIYFRARNTGSALNGTAIFTTGSKFIIQEDEDEYIPPFVLPVESGDRGDFERLTGSGSGSSGYWDGINTVIEVRTPQGGEDQLTDVGPAKVYLQKIDREIKTENIVSTDNYAAIGQKIHAALNADSEVTANYNLTTNDTGTQYQINFQSIRGGKKYNSPVDVNFTIRGDSVEHTDIFSANLNDISGGQDSNLNGTLENDQDYWYKARYRYTDGHVTATSFALHANTGPAENIELTIQISHSDIDGNRPDVEIFRKKEGEDFYLIDTVTPSTDTKTYLDSGEPQKDLLDERINIWSKSHEAQTIARNKYVRGNIEYFGEEYSTPNFTVGTTSSSDQKELPKGSLARVFVRPQYEDGTFGYHSKAGEVVVDEYAKKLTLDQNAAISNSDKSIDRLGVYANYLSQAEEYTYRFNSPEIANEHIPTIADTSFYPETTRIFFGFKYIVYKRTTDGGSVVTGVGSWDTSDTGHSTMAIDNPTNVFDPDAGNNPRQVTLRAFGNEFTYNRVYFQRHPDVNTTYKAIYKLDVFDALRDAVKSGELKLRLANSAIASLSTKGDEGGASSLLTNEELLKTTVRVTGLVDRASEEPQVQFDDDLIIAPSDSRIYLELEESRFDKIDNRNVNKYSLKGDYSIPITHLLGSDQTISYEFVNFSEATAPSFNSYPGDGNKFDGGQPEKDKQHTYYSYDWDFSIYDLINTTNVTDRDTLIYLGSKANANDAQYTLDLTGFTQEESDNINFTFLSDFNIYEDRVGKTDINIDKTEFTNQIVWSENLTTTERFSGGRNIDYTNFFSISSENGPIQWMEELSGRLYVFCETGVAVCNIGETLTQQKGGQVYVGSSDFITDYQWAIEGLSDIKRDSIVKHKGSIYFTDGEDVYSLSGGLNNLSQGKIPLSPDKTYSAKIDSEHYEYQLADRTAGETWVYNYEVGQWYGPFTYASKKGATYQDTVVSVVGSGLFEHNTTNAFDGSAFTTLLESTAFDDQESVIDKTWRKFYINSENDTNATFSYGKDFTSMNSTDNSGATLNLGSVKTRNGYKHIGVKGAENSSKIIYWEISTQDSGFKLKDFSVAYKLRRRR